jgi:dolichol-phosphate mannosyltransferase
VSAEAPPLLSIIVPTYNERDRLAELAAAFFAACSSEGLEAELVVVDDNSPDGTGALAEELARQRRMRVVHRPGKMGLGTAVIDGIEAATAPVVGVIDADLSHPPSVLPRMFAVMRQANADVVVASRYITGCRVSLASWRGG